MTDETTTEETPTPADEATTPDESTTDDTTPGVGQGDETPDTFPRDYVENLRKENGRYRQRASDRDALAQRLHTSLVTATGRLADPTDLPFDDAHLEDADALNAAIDELLERKPHLASRRPRGDVGQGITTKSEAVDLAGILRANASN